MALLFLCFPYPGKTSSCKIKFMSTLLERCLFTTFVTFEYLAKSDWLHVRVYSSNSCNRLTVGGFADSLWARDTRYPNHEHFCKCFVREIQLRQLTRYPSQQRRIARSLLEMKILLLFNPAKCEMFLRTNGHFQRITRLREVIISALDFLLRCLAFQYQVNYVSDGLCGHVVGDALMKTLLCLVINRVCKTR